MRPKAGPKCNRDFILPTSLASSSFPPDFAHLLEIHLNESEVALDGPVDPGSAFKTDPRGRKSRKHLKILYRKHLNCGRNKPDRASTTPWTHIDWPMQATFKAWMLRLKTLWPSNA